MESEDHGHYGGEEVKGSLGTGPVVTCLSGKEFGSILCSEVLSGAELKRRWLICFTEDTLRVHNVHSSFMG